MAPEVITEATHSKAADVYSFGVVLFELLSGCKPYHGMHYAQIVSSITSGKLLQLLPQQAPHLPPGLLELMASCLATKPVDRPTFIEVHSTLRQMEETLIAQQQEQEQRQEQQFVPMQQQQFAMAEQQQQQVGYGCYAAPAAAAAAAAAAGGDGAACNSCTDQIRAQATAAGLQ
jgi:serine/threonine protein kinase